MSRFPLGRDQVSSDLQGEDAVIVETDEAIDLLLDGLVLRDLDHQGGRELAGVRDEGCVGLDLVCDRRRIGDPFDPAHLLNLVADGGAVLEIDRDAVAELDPALAP